MQTDSPVENQYSILVQPIGTSVTMRARIYAVDVKGNWAVTSVFEIVVRQLPATTTTAHGQPMSGAFVIGLVGTAGLGIILGVVITLAGLRVLRKRAGLG